MSHSRNWLAVAGALSQRIAARRPRRPRQDIQVVVFSKDRAAQLDLLLRSWARHGVGAPRVDVLWHSTSDRHERAYREVFERHRAVVARRTQQTHFRADLLRMLRLGAASRVMFLVDDLVLRARFDFAWLDGVDPLRAVASLRLGPEVNYCQTQARPIQPPPLRPAFDGWLQFNWCEAWGDWAMPLSLDGNLFHRGEMCAILSRVPFKAPNSLEHALGPYRFLFRRRRGLCRPAPALLNLALNRVQSEEFDFPHGEVDAEQLLRQWEEGLELDLSAVESLDAKSCHVVVEPAFARRAAGAQRQP